MAGSDLGKEGKEGKRGTVTYFCAPGWRREFNGTVQPTQTAVVTFQYDNRDRLIHETRVVNGSTTVYDLWYTYDGLGNRLEKRDDAASPRTKTTYFYDTDPANRDRPSAPP